MAGPRILIVGGGYVGLHSALRLQKRYRRTGAKVTIVDPNAYMTYQPFLPEAAAGSLDPRHVVVPLRGVLKRCEVVSGRVTGLVHAHHVATVEPLEGDSFDVEYDLLVFAGGSVARTLPIPGLADVGVGLKSVQEAEYLRNQVLSRLDAAGSTMDPAQRAKALTFLVIGGGFAGIECLGELEDLARAACRTHPRIKPSDMRWILVEASGRVLPEVSESMGAYTVAQLQRRGIDVRLSTRVESLVDGHARLSDGTEFCTGTVIWTAGVKANPLLSRTDLPLDTHGRVQVAANFQIVGTSDAWSAGDCAAVPDLSQPDGSFCSPSAQHAVRQAKVLGENINRTMRGKQQVDYRHVYIGSVASLGLYKGVADIYGVKIKGFPAWWIHRTYHMLQIPTFNRKVRVVADWTIAMFFPREVASMGHVDDPRTMFRRAASDGLTTATTDAPEAAVEPRRRPTPRRAPANTATDRSAHKSKTAA